LSSIRKNQIGELKIIRQQVSKRGTIIRIKKNLKKFMAVNKKTQVLHYLLKRKNNGTT